jgi:hypothetical protein
MSFNAASIDPDAFLLEHCWFALEQLVDARGRQRLSAPRAAAPGGEDRA